MKYKDEIKEKDEKIENLEKTLGLNDYDIFICAYESTPFVQIKMAIFWVLIDLQSITNIEKKSSSRKF